MNWLQTAPVHHSSACVLLLKQCTIVHTSGAVEYVWDPLKAAANFRKHEVRFADAALSLEDPRAWVIADPDAVDEERFISLGADPTGQVLVTAFTLRGTVLRIISSRRASRMERHHYESQR